MASFAALIKHIEFTKNIVYKSKALNIVFENTEKLAYIDHNTSKYLELVYNARNVDSYQNLFGILNYTKTKAGSKMLRSNLLQPLYDLEKIELRLEAVDSLIQDQSFLIDLQNCVEKFIDLEDIMMIALNTNARQLNNTGDSNTIKSVENKIGKLFIIKQVLDSVEKLTDLLSQTKSKLLDSIFSVNKSIQNLLSN